MKITVTLLTTGPWLGTQWTEKALKEAADKFVGVPVSVGLQAEKIGEVLHATYVPGDVEGTGRIDGIVEILDSTVKVDNFSIVTPKIRCRVCGKESSCEEDFCEHLKLTEQNDICLGANPKRISICLGDVNFHNTRR